ncbi:MAG: DNA translocase FtsK [Candidatus Limisoma sp.]
MALKIDKYNPVYKGKGKGTAKDTDNVAEEGNVDDVQDVADDKKQSAPKRQKKDKDAKDKKPLIRKVVGFALLLIGCLLLIACVSYFKNCTADQSAVNSHTLFDNLKDATSIKNKAGILGALVAEILINSGFGYGSFFIIIFCIILGLKYMGHYKPGIFSALLICSFATITTSSILGLVSLSIESAPFAIGGSHGYQLAMLMTNLVGTYGAIFFNILLLVVLFVLCVNRITAIYSGIKERVDDYRKKREEQRLRELKEAENAFESEPEEPEDNEQPNKNNEKNGVELESIMDSTDANGFDQLSIDNVVDEDDDDSVADAQADTPEKEPADMPETEVANDDDSAPQTSATEEGQQPNPDDTPLEIVENAPIAQAEVLSQTPYDPTAELSRFKLPPSTLLNDYDHNDVTVDKAEQEENKNQITKTLRNYGIEIRSIKVCVGPTVTLYEIIPAEGVRIAKIKGLEDDIALSLAALGIRIIAPIPGKGTIGIEVPNKEKRMVPIRAIIESDKFQKCNYELPIAMGSTISNDVYVADLARTPHLLVAGATGMGKSVGLNTIITCLLYKKHPSQLKFVMIDPKMVEFSMYAPLEYHYLAKMEDSDSAIITDMNKAVATLNSLVQEMEDRLVLLNDAHERNIGDYNRKFIARRLDPAKGHKYLPYIVVIIDELADLIMNIGRKEIETPIARITQKARAVGIHMILATQRPSTDIITGVIKANCPSRIAFRVTQMVDSRTILDRSGAQQLIGRGDMLINYENVLTRVQCAFVDTPEVEAIVNSISSQNGFDSPYLLPRPAESNADVDTSIKSLSERDSLFEEAAEFIITSGSTASTSSLQRRFSIGYNRAGKLMDQMEAAGIVGPSLGGKPRQVLVDHTQLSMILNR